MILYWFLSFTPVEIFCSCTAKPCINYKQKISPNKSTRTSSLLYSSQVTQCMSCTAVMRSISTYPHSPLQSNAQTGLSRASLPQPAYLQPSITQLLHWKKPVFSVTNCPRGLSLTTEPDRPHTNKELLKKERGHKGHFPLQGKITTHGSQGSAIEGPCPS